MIGERAGVLYNLGKERKNKEISLVGWEWNVPHGRALKYRPGILFGC